MRNFEENYPAVGLDPSGGIGEYHEQDWHKRKPALILDSGIYRLAIYDPIRELNLVQETDDSPIVDLRDRLFSGIASAFANEDCEVINWPPEGGKRNRVGRRRSDYFPDLEFFMGLRAMDMGAFNKEQKAALQIPVTDEPSFRKFLEAYEAASPQNMPLVMGFAREVDLGETAPATYANVLFRQVEPGDGIPEKLEPLKIQAMNWVDNAHQGSWKVIQVFWEMMDHTPQFRTAIVGALEGSRPQFGLTPGVQAYGDIEQIAPEIGRRLKIFGSTKEVFAEIKKAEKNARPEYDVDPLPAVPKGDWNNLPAVITMMKTGRYLGMKGLISGAIEMDQLAHGRVLPRLLKRTASYSQQAESARCLWEPKISELIVSVTGTLGGSKTESSEDDFVAVRPGGRLGLMLRRIGDTLKPKKPSVEAREFALPLYKIAEEVPGFAFKVRYNEENDTYTQDENGEYTMWRVVGVDHLHRDVKLDELDLDEIIVVQPDDMDAVGCGVDANEDKSEYAVRQAFAQAQQFYAEKGYWPTSAVVYVPNHGWNAIKFAKEDESGNFGSDLDKGFRDAIETGALVYGTFAEGVTQV